ncbi:MAG: hypothetical protein WBV23_08030 [Desulfobaccales bacterium]
MTDLRRQALRLSYYHTIKEEKLCSCASCSCLPPAPGDGFS